MQTLMKCSVMLYFIWIFTVCQSIRLGVFHNDSKTHISFYYPSYFSYVVGTQINHLNEMVILGTHKVGFDGVMNLTLHSLYFTVIQIAIVFDHVFCH